MEEWKTIEEFPTYMVSSFGNIVNTHNNFMLTPSRNQHGVMQVGMMKNGIQCKRSLPKLVAEAFVPKPENPRFNAVLHKDGQQTHNFASNLLWRPRPFIHMYNDQFRNPYHNRVNMELVNLNTGETFENSLEAAKHYGVLEKAVVHSILNDDEPVFPIGHCFDVI